MAKAKHEALRNRSKFEIKDRHPGTKRMGFVPKRREGLFDRKEPTSKQFFEEIKHMGNIDVFYKGKKRFSRGM